MAEGKRSTGVLLINGNKNLGILETNPEVFLDACYQRCTVYFYRKIFSVATRNKIKGIALMLKTTHAQENKEASREKAAQIAEKLREMRLGSVAKKLQGYIEKTHLYVLSPQHETGYEQTTPSNDSTERSNTR